MKWINLDDIRTVAMETSYLDEAFAPDNQLSEGSICNQHHVSENKGLWHWVPVHTDTFERHVTSSQSSNLGNEN